MAGKNVTIEWKTMADPSSPKSLVVIVDEPGHLLLRDAYLKWLRNPTSANQAYDLAYYTSSVPPNPDIWHTVFDFSDVRRISWRE